MGRRYHDNCGIWRYEVKPPPLPRRVREQRCNSAFTASPTSLFLPPSSFSDIPHTHRHTQHVRARGPSPTFPPPALFCVRHDLLLYFDRCGAVFECRLLRGGWLRELFLQIHPRRVLVGRSHHDYRGLWRHDV